MIKFLTPRETSRLKIKVGGTYVTRGGDIVTIVRETTIHDSLCLYGYDFVDTDGRVYTHQGKFYRDTISDRDLVKPYNQDGKGFLSWVSQYSSLVKSIS